MKKTVLTGLVLASLSACTNSNTDIQKKESMTVQNQPVGLVEITTFKLNAGVSNADFLAATAQMQKDFLSVQDGFIKRTLTVSADSSWTDIVSWKDENSHGNAMKIAEKSEKVVPFMTKIDFKSVKMTLAKPVFNN
ncbi:MAG: hypothetical protein RL757_1860 [Bacteroidota bacterium]|jgi:hypothetical protein